MIRAYNFRYEQLRSVSKEPIQSTRVPGFESYFSTFNHVKVTRHCSEKRARPHILILSTRLKTSTRPICVNHTSIILYQGQLCIYTVLFTPRQTVLHLASRNTILKSHPIIQLPRTVRFAVGRQVALAGVLAIATSSLENRPLGSLDLWQVYCQYFFPAGRRGK